MSLGVWCDICGAFDQDMLSHLKIHSEQKRVIELRTSISGENTTKKECDKRKSLLEPIAEEDIRETSVCVVSFNENNGIHYIRMATANDDLEPLIVFSKFGAKKGQTMINVPSDKGDACFEVKKECDHIVIVSAVTTAEGYGTLFKRRSGKSFRKGDYKPEHCPECGEKLNLK